VFFSVAGRDDDEIIPNVINAVKVVTGKARMKADPASS